MKESCHANGILWTGLQVVLKLQLHSAIYRLRFYSNSLIHILSLSNSHSDVTSRQKNLGDKSHSVIVALRWISCHSRNYSQPYFFKRNQSSDNRSDGFGAKFLLKKLSASDFSYERKSAFRRLMDSCKLLLFCHHVTDRNPVKDAWNGESGVIKGSFQKHLKTGDGLKGKRCL